MNRRAETLDLWYDYVDVTYRRAEEECGGCLLDSRRRDKFVEFFGAGMVKTVMFGGGPAKVAYHFASEELVRWWERNPRLTWSEFAHQAGIRDRQTTLIARGAPDARAAAARLAWNRFELGA